MALLLSHGLPSASATTTSSSKEEYLLSLNGFSFHFISFQLFAVLLLSTFIQWE